MLLFIAFRIQRLQSLGKRFRFSSAETSSLCASYLGMHARLG